jgi:hypothetical protein
VSGSEPGVFLLGVGCHKGGTTWLHDHLLTSPQVAPGHLKEYHVFDILDGVAPAQMRETMLGRAQQALAAARSHGGRQIGPVLRAAFLADPELYFDYFAGLLSRPGIRAAADITPGYAGLGADRLTSIRDGFAARGVPVKVLLLVRDPVERIGSAVRMFLRDTDGLPGVPAESVEERVLRTYADGFNASRTRYDLTLEQVDQAFEPDEVHVEFYERLFTADATDRVCALLGIDPVPADFTRRLNASPRGAALSAETVLRVARHYRPVYAALAARVGDDVLDGLWPTWRLLRHEDT